MFPAFHQWGADGHVRGSADETSALQP